MHKVYVNRPDHFFYYNVKMTADYCNFPLETVICDEEKCASKDFKTWKAHRKFPILETPQGALINDSYAISAYIARAAGNTSFVGATPFEEASINQWASFSASSIVPNMYPIAYHAFGIIDDQAASTNATKSIKDAMKTLNGQLNGKAWLVGDRLTLADIVTFNALLVPFTFVLDGGVRKAFPNAAAWWLKMSKLPVVTRSAGYTKWVGAGQDAPAAAAGGAKGGKQKGGKAKGGDGGKKAAAPKKEEKKAATPAAEEDDLDDLFGDDGGDGGAAAAEAMKKKAEEAKSKKKKAAPIAKSLIVWDVKPWGEETDLEALANKILGIEMDGLFWKTQWKKEPVAYGVFKIQIGATVEDDKVSTDLIQEAMEAFEDDVQSVDIVAFNKL